MKIVINDLVQRLLDGDSISQLRSSLAALLDDLEALHSLLGASTKTKDVRCVEGR